MFQKVSFTPAQVLFISPFMRGDKELQLDKQYLLGLRQLPQVLGATRFGSSPDTYIPLALARELVTVIVGSRNVTFGWGFFPHWK